MQKSKIGPQVFAAISATSILISVGYHFGWPAPALARLLSNEYDIPITSSQGSWIVSFLLIGMMFGSALGFFLVGKLGRKPLLLLMVFPLCISCVLISVATNYWYLYVARFVAGIGSGVVLLTIPMYTGEIAEDRVRGGLGILIGVMMNVGEVLAYSVGPWASRVVFSAVGASVPIIFAVIFIWSPESPYYYASKGEQYNVEKSLTWLRGTADVTAEVEKIQNNVDMRRSHVGSVKDLFTIKGNRKALLIMVGLLSFQQLSGGNAISAYSTIIFDEVDTALSSSVIVIILGVIKLIAAISIIFLTDMVGRRPLLLVSALLCAFFLIGEAVYFNLRFNGTNMSRLSWLPIVAMVGYLISYTIGIGTIPLVITSEIFPLNVKAIAMTIAAMFLAAAGMGVTKLYQVVADAYSIYVIFYGFAACCILSMVFVFFFVPETKKRSFIEIQKELQGDTTLPMLSRPNLTS